MKDEIWTLIDVEIVDLMHVNLFPWSCTTWFVAFNACESISLILKICLLSMQLKPMNVAIVIDTPHINSSF
jgi:hypothetical protein